MMHADTPPGVCFQLLRARAAALSDEVAPPFERLRMYSGREIGFVAWRRRGGAGRSFELVVDCHVVGLLAMAGLLQVLPRFDPFDPFDGLRAGKLRAGRLRMYSGREMVRRPG